MKTANFFMALLATALLASCSDDKDYSGDFGQIKVPDTRQLEQTVSADDTQSAQGVTFSTEGAWTSTITQTRAEAPDWISVSPDHGDAAGTYTLKITLQTNPLEESRTAKIVITCGTSKIEISVTQEATDNPITPTLNSWISKIECFYEEEENPEKNRQTANLYFEYDKQNRISKYSYEDLEDQSEGIDQVIAFTYPDARTLKIKSTEDEDTEAFTVTLNDAGFATEMRRDGGSERWTFAYDAQNRCTECKQTGIDASLSYPRSTFDWSEGNLVAFNTFKEDGSKAAEYCYTMTYDTDFKNQVLSTSLDLNALIFNVNPGFISEYDTVGILLSTINRLGVRSANLTKTNLTDEEFSIEMTQDYLYYHEIRPENEIIQWELDDAGRVTRVFCTARVQYIQEDRKTHEKTVIEEKSYTRREIYNILY